METYLFKVIVQYELYVGDDKANEEHREEYLCEGYDKMPGMLILHRLHQKDGTIAIEMGIPFELLTSYEVYETDEALQRVHD